jgi:hypothetical protein
MLDQHTTGALATALINWAWTRPADFLIGGIGNPYLRRWYRIPRNRWFNVYVHELLRSDDDRALHDHPWCNVSVILDGSYTEHTIAKGGIHHRAIRRPGDVVFRLPWAAHRLEVSAPCWSLFITGPVVRQWGFHCERGWVPWQQFVDATDTGSVGRGCGEAEHG